MLESDQQRAAVPRFTEQSRFEVRVRALPDKLSFRSKLVEIITSTNCFYMLITSCDTVAVGGFPSLPRSRLTPSLTNGQVYVPTNPAMHRRISIFTLLFIMLLDFISFGTRIAL